jgi:hypothetical protein
VCDLTKGCPNDGSHVAQIVVVMRVGPEFFTIPSITNVCVCDPCKTLAQTPSDVLHDGGERMVRVLLGLRRNSRFVSKSLGWTTVDDPDYKRLRGKVAS